MTSETYERKQRAEPQTICISVRLVQHYAGKLQKEARRRGCTLSQLIRDILETWIRAA